MSSEVGKINIFILLNRAILFFTYNLFQMCILSCHLLWTSTIFLKKCKTKISEGVKHYLTYLKEIITNLLNYIVHWYLPIANVHISREQILDFLLLLFPLFLLSPLSY